MVQNIQLTKNFSLYEFLKSPTAERIPALNLQQFNPPGYVIENLKKTAELMQKIRDWYGLPIRITSGYRCKELNALIGGSPTSQHPLGEAADFEPLDASGREATGKDYKRVAVWIAMSLQYRQLIKEFGSRDCPAWLHVAHKDTDNKKQNLEIGTFTGNKYISLDFDNWQPLI